MPKEKKLIVLCLNDFPVGIYTSDEKANVAESMDRAGRGSGYRLRYHRHEFVVDAKATL